MELKYSVPPIKRINKSAVKNKNVIDGIYSKKIKLIMRLKMVKSSNLLSFL